MENFLLLAETETNAAVIIFNLILAFILGGGIALVYRKTHQGLSYFQQFLTTLVLLSVLGSVVMMVVSQNLVGAFALLGAFSLIRFRTILKETRDIAFVFFALVVGVAIGVNSYVVAVLSTVIISLFIIILQRYDFGSVLRGGHLLIVTAGNSFTPESAGRWRDLATRVHVLHAKTLSDSLIEYTLDISLRDPDTVSALAKELRNANGVSQVEVMSGRNALEH